MSIAHIPIIILLRCLFRCWRRNKDYLLTYLLTSIHSLLPSNGKWWRTEYWWWPPAPDEHLEQEHRQTFHDPVERNEGQAHGTDDCLRGPLPHPEPQFLSFAHTPIPLSLPGKLSLCPVCPGISKILWPASCCVDEPPQAQTQQVIFLDIDSFHPIDLVVLPTPGLQGMHSFLTYLILYWI